LSKDEGHSENFDLAKKQLDGGSISQGYSMGDGRIYTAYYTNEKWASFKTNMEALYPRAYDDFMSGYGNELSERNMKGKMVPPKMASYSSSSRFIFELSKDIPGFHFECKLPISIPGRYAGQEAEASLDGYIPTKNIYIEAKCHEIYKRGKTEFKEKYRTFYDYLRRKTQGDFNFRVDSHITRGGNEIEYVEFFWKQNRIENLDLKQLLCHMLGIAKKSLTSYHSERPCLLYLVYKPSQKLLNYIQDDSVANQIISIWEKEKDEANMIDFQSLYFNVVHYLNEQEKIGIILSQPEVSGVGNSFDFRFCDQDEYKRYLNP